jgi:hypothetical protein
MTAPVQRKLPGTPIPREQLVADWEDLHHRNLMDGPGGQLLVRRPLLGAGEDVPVARADLVSGFAGGDL